MSEPLEGVFQAVGERPFVVVSDTQFADTYKIYSAFARHLAQYGIVLVVITECERPARDNVVLLPIDRVAPADPSALQQRYDFSLFKPLVCERSITDFCTFRTDEVYSGLSVEQFMDRYTRFIHAYDGLFARGGVFVGMLHDTFKSALAARIAAFHRRPVLLPIAYYWWPDGVLFFDTPDQGAKEIEERYRHYLANPALIDRARADVIYAAKARTFVSNAVPPASLREKLVNVWNSRRSPEPFSWRHFVSRRARRLATSLTGGIRPDYLADPAAVTGAFLLFPLHVAPEASILGGAPELADQFSMIKNLALNLPLGIQMLVKEHPDQQKSRLGRAFYDRLASLPNVRLVRADVSAVGLMRRPECAGVAVINGTLGLEAAYEGKRVFVPRGAAWYAFCGAFTTLDRWSDVFTGIQAPLPPSARPEITALLLAMDDCVEPIERKPEGTYTFREAGQFGMSAVARKVHKVLERHTCAA